MHRLRCLVVIGALAVAVSMVGAGPAFAAKGGNNDTAKVCQKHGWEMLAPDAGGTFANQGDCVNDGAQGSAPFGAAGKAACDAVSGIFTHGPGSWTCVWDLSFGSDSLEAACATDSGGFQETLLEDGNLEGVCNAEPEPPPV